MHKSEHGTFCFHNLAIQFKKTRSFNSNLIKNAKFFFSLGFYWLLIAGLIASIDTRLAPAQNAADTPLTIDDIATNNILYNPAFSSNYQVVKRQSTPPRANTTVCYTHVGCFDNNDPFNNAASELPQSPETIDTAFLLFTQEAPTNPEFLSYEFDDEKIMKSSINPSRWLRIIIHGFTNNRDSVWIPKLTAELLKLKNVRKSNKEIFNFQNDY